MFTVCCHCIVRGKNFLWCPCFCPPLLPLGFSGSGASSSFSCNPLLLYMSPIDMVGRWGGGYSSLISSQYLIKPQLGIFLLSPGRLERAGLELSCSPCPVKLW